MPSYIAVSFLLFAKASLRGLTRWPLRLDWAVVAFCGVDAVEKRFLGCRGSSGVCSGLCDYISGEAGCMEDALASSCMELAMMLGLLLGGSLGAPLSRIGA